jgi:hypothetical protein
MERSAALDGAPGHQKIRANFLWATSSNCHGELPRALAHIEHEWWMPQFFTVDRILVITESSLLPLWGILSMPRGSPGRGWVRGRRLLARGSHSHGCFVILSSNPTLCFPEASPLSFWKFSISSSTPYLQDYRIILNCPVSIFSTRTLLYTSNTVKMVKAGECISLIPTPHSGLGQSPDRVIRHSGGDDAWARLSKYPARKDWAQP